MAGQPKIILVHEPSFGKRKAYLESWSEINDDEQFNKYGSCIEKYA